MAGTKPVVVVNVHPLKGMGGVVERVVRGVACHGKIEEVFSRGIATTKLSRKQVRTFDKMVHKFRSSGHDYLL